MDFYYASVIVKSLAVHLFPVFALHSLAAAFATKFAVLPQKYARTIHRGEVTSHKDRRDDLTLVIVVLSV